MTEHVNPNTLVVVSTAAHPVLASVKGVDHDRLVQMMEEEDRFNSMFPGKAYTFKKGHWYEGFGKKAELVDKLFREKSIIVNAPNINFAWRMFSDEGKPVYLSFANPSNGTKLPERKTLGHTDKELWEVSELNNKPQDPIQQIAMVPFRFDGEKEVHHFVFSSWSAVRAVRDFLKAYGKEGRRHIGQLPVVNVDVNIEKHWDDESITFDIPVLGIADWENPIAEDIIGTPESDSMAATNESAGDIPSDSGVKQIGRVEKAPEASEAASNSMKEFIKEVDAERKDGLFPGTKGEDAKKAPEKIGSGRRRKAA